MYKSIINPDLDKNLNYLTKAKANKHLQWFIENKDKSIEHLQKFLNKVNSGVELDYTESSLIKLWKWYQNRILIKNLTIDESIELNYRLPHWREKSIDRIELGEEIINIGYDISIYLGDYIIKNNPEAYWGIITGSSRLHNVNRPLLKSGKAKLGFRLDSLIINELYSAYKNKNDEFLLNEYHRIIKNIRKKDVYYPKRQFTLVPENFVNLSEISVDSLYEEIEVYREWYINELKEYIEHLKPDIKLDYSIESLDGVWEFLYNKMEMVEMTSEELEKANKNRFVWSYPYSKIEFTEKTKELAYNISLYFGEVLIENNPNIEWTVIYKENSISPIHNRPVLINKKNKDFILWPYSVIEDIMKENIDKKIYELKEIEYSENKERNNKIKHTTNKYEDLESKHIIYENINISLVEREEAQRYYHYFLDLRYDFIENLEKYIQRDNPKIKLDYSIDSLIDLWDWFRDKVSFVDSDKDNLYKLENRREIWMYSFSENDISFNTKRIVYDLGIYLGEILIANNKELSWIIYQSPYDFYFDERVGINGFINKEQKMWPDAVIEQLIREEGALEDKEALIKVFYKWYKESISEKDIAEINNHFENLKLY